MSKDNSDFEGPEVAFNSAFLRRYIEVAPLALAIERTVECNILAQQRFLRPVLDIGSGDGVFAAVLFAEAIDTGVDYDPDEIERSRQYARYEELIACSGDNIPKPDGSYRTIFSNSVLEHIPNLRAVVEEQYRLLAPGGRFYVTIPTDRWERSSVPATLLKSVGLRSLARSYARFYNSFWKHYHAYPEEVWEKLFQDAGFKVVQKKTYAPPKLTFLLDALTPLGGPGMISKKLLGRWIAAPAIRKGTAPLLHGLFNGLVERWQFQPPGNLLFLELEK